MLADGRGLFLLIRRSSTTWLVRRRHLGRMRVTTLGRYPELPLAAARATAAALATQTPGSTETARELVEEFKTGIRDSRRDPEQVDGCLDRGLPAGFLAQRVAAVTRADVVVMLNDYKRQAPVKPSLAALIAAPPTPTEASSSRCSA